MNHLSSVQRTIQTEIDGLQNILLNLGHEVDDVVNELLDCKGKVVISGMGKSGLIGQKMAATFASTGTPSFFVHPGEAAHGDMGMIEEVDVVILLSYSGETEELLKMLAFMNPKVVTVGISGNSNSTLAANCNHHLSVEILKEACPLELAPTTSTTATLALGDALAVALMEARKFRAEDFARFHPGGSLGRKLLTSVGDVCRRENLPFVDPTTSAEELLIRMSQGKLGLAIIGTPESIKGIITDGDLRRGLVKYGSFKELNIEQWMSKNPKTVPVDMRVVKVEEMMIENKITATLVEQNGRVIGVYQIFNR